MCFYKPKEFLRPSRHCGGVRTLCISSWQGSQKIFWSISKQKKLVYSKHSFYICPPEQNKSRGVKNGALENATITGIHAGSTTTKNI